MKVYANTSSLKQSSSIQQALHKAKIPSPQKKNKGAYPVYDLNSTAYDSLSGPYTHKY